MTINPQVVTGDAAFQGSRVDTRRLDANISYFLDEELVKIDERVFEQAKPSLNAFNLFPIKSDFMDWQKNYKYRALDSLGAANIIDPAAGDFPIVNVSREQFETPLLPIGAAVKLDSRDLAASANLGLSLDEALFSAARRAIEEKANAIAFSGELDAGLNGILTHPGILRAASANVMAAATSAANHLTDLNKLANFPPNNSGQVEAPDLALFPPDSYQALSQQARSTGTDTTTLSFWLGTNGYISQAQPIRELSGATIRTAGAEATSDCALSFRRDPAVLEFLYTGIQRLPMMQTGPLTFLIPFVAYCGGMVIRMPKSVMMLTAV